MGARCTEQDWGLKASTMFRNIHCVGRRIQRNILGLNHTTSFNRLVLQIIHDLMTRQHTVCINTTIFHIIITNSTHKRGAKYSHPVLITRLCRNFLPDAVFDSYNIVFVAPERATSAYNSCLHVVWTLVSSLKMPRLSPLRRNFWRMMMTRPFGSRTLN